MKKSKYSITITDCQEGYTQGTYGYIIRDNKSNIWCDGGFPSKKMAINYAKKFIKSLD